MGGQSCRGGDHERRGTTGPFFINGDQWVSDASPWCMLWMDLMVCGRNKRWNSSKLLKTCCTVEAELFWVFSDFFPLDTLNTALEGLTVLVDVAGHYPTPLVLVVVTRVTRKTPAEPPPAAACPCPLERPRPAGR